VPFGNEGVELNLIVNKTVWVSVFNNEVTGVTHVAPEPSPVALNPDAPVACRLFPLISNHVVVFPVKLSGLKTSRQRPKSLVTIPGLYDIAT
jgi:hypothetical protein